MLTVHIPGSEGYDPVHNTIFSSPPQTLQLEHSLISISKWEAKWHEPFLIPSYQKLQKHHTNEQMLDYVRCMTLTQNVNNAVYYQIPQSVMQEITDYIADPMTATWFAKQQGAPSREIVTSELIYYWMIACGIPFECQKWHLNRLLTLIRVCNAKENGGKKMSRNEIYRQNAELNRMRLHGGHK